PLCLSYSLRPPPPTCTLFPYTTLFRSLDLLAPVVLRDAEGGGVGDGGEGREAEDGVLGSEGAAQLRLQGRRMPQPAAPRKGFSRSEEHTSELQSRENLVCRLRLEKKKT